MKKAITIWLATRGRQISFLNREHEFFVTQILHLEEQFKCIQYVKQTREAIENDAQTFLETRTKLRII